MKKDIFILSIPISILTAEYVSIIINWEIGCSNHDWLTWWDRETVSLSKRLFIFQWIWIWSSVFRHSLFLNNLFVIQLKQEMHQYQFWYPSASFHDLWLRNVFSVYKYHTKKIILLGFRVLDEIFRNFSEGKGLIFTLKLFVYCKVVKKTIFIRKIGFY